MDAHPEYLGKHDPAECEFCWVYLTEPSYARIEGARVVRSAPRRTAGLGSPRLRWTPRILTSRRPVVALVARRALTSAEADALREAWLDARDREPIRPMIRNEHETVVRVDVDRSWWSRFRPRFSG